MTGVQNPRLLPFPIASTTGQLANADQIILNDPAFVGVLDGTTDIQTALRRIDGTGVGADLFTFTGAYSAQASNISEWFGGKQVVRMRCTGRGGNQAGNLPFTLPGATALATAFATLQALGIEERILFFYRVYGGR